MLTNMTEVVLILAVLVLPPYFYHKFRAKKFEQYANKNGLSFAEEKFSIPLENVGQFFLTGNRNVFQRWYRNVIHGERSGTQFFIFEYSYRPRRGAGRYGSISKPQTVLICISPTVSLPHFALLPKHTFVWNHPVFGDKFLEIKDDKQFSSLYLLQGEYHGIVQNLFDEKVRAHFVRLVNKSCEGKGAQFLYYYDGHRFDPSRLDAFIEEAFAAFELFRSKKNTDVVE